MPESRSVDGPGGLRHLRVDLAELSPESFMPDDLREILGDMIRSKATMENCLREHFLTPTEAEQAMLLVSLGESGCRDRAWWCRILMDGLRPQGLPDLLVGI